MSRKIPLAAVATTAVLLAAPFSSQSAAYDTPGGAALARLTAQWWQWAVSIPNVSPPEGGSIHPLVGDNGSAGELDFFEYCGNGQHGNVWFLGGDFSGVGDDWERTCVIPFGKDVLVAVINWECSTAEGDAIAGDPAWQQALDLRDCAKGTGDILGGSARFGPEGGPLEEVTVKRARTVLPFSLYFPPNNVFGLEEPFANPSLSMADGQWVFLRNLNPGRYRLEFTGEAGDPPFFEINGNYNIEIAQPNGEPPSE